MKNLVKLYMVMHQITMSIIFKIWIYDTNCKIHVNPFEYALKSFFKKVYAFDIQEEALDHTRQRLEKAGYQECAVLIQDGHERMKEYVTESVSAIVFNFGYLPGGDHQIATRPDTSVPAVKCGLELLKPGGVMSLCIYSGGDTGYEERDALLAYVRDLDPKKWLVIVNSYYNRKNDPPIPVFIIRLA